MGKFCRNQAGKLSLEAVAWMVLALLLVALGGAAGFSIMGNKTDSTQKLLTKQTLVCPANSVALDVRQFVAAGVPITGGSPSVSGGGAIPGSSFTIIPNGPYVDANSDKLTAEFVCVNNVAGY